MAADPQQEDRGAPASRRRLVLVAGSGRSGTSVFAGILQQLGFYVPKPEVQADSTNPRGFSEPQWVVDFHQRLLRNNKVAVSDARPTAWFRTGKAGRLPEVQRELRNWLEEQFRISDDVVIKDPRLSWFLPLWQSAAEDLHAAPSFVTMLRHPAEVLDSKQKWYGTWQGNASRAAGWLNMMLYTERATRDAPRVFVQYEDLLSDWTQTVGRVGDTLDLPVIHTCSAVAMRRVHQFVDPNLRRSQLTWDDFNIPPRLQELTEDVWGQISRLGDPATTDTEAIEALKKELDESRANYVTFYEEAEAIAQSSIVAERPRRPRPTGAAQKKQAPRSLAHRVARRIPQRYRRRVPVTLRRQILRTARRPA